MTSPPSPSAKNSKKKPLIPPRAEGELFIFRESTIEEFAAELERDLEKLEIYFEEYVTPHSRRRSLNR